MKHPFRATFAALIALLAALALAPSALGGKPSPAPSSIELNQSDPHLGGAVNFSVTYPREVKSPRIAVRCYGYDSAGYAEAGPYDKWFVLGGASSDWQRAGGDAQCIADLFYFTWKPNRPQEYHWLGSTSFEARG